MAIWKKETGNLQLHDDLQRQDHIIPEDVWYQDESGSRIHAEQSAQYGNAPDQKYQGWPCQYQNNPWENQILWALYHKADKERGATITDGAKRQITIWHLHSHHSLTDNIIPSSSGHIVPTGSITLSRQSFSNFARHISVWLMFWYRKKVLLRIWFIFNQSRFSIYKPIAIIRNLFHDLYNFPYWSNCYMYFSLKSNTSSTSTNTNSVMLNFINIII